MKQTERYNLNEFNEPVSKRGFKLVGFLVMLSVFLMSVYFGIKVNKKYPYSNDEYIFVIESKPNGYIKHTMVMDSITLWNKAQAYIGMYKIYPYKYETHYEFKDVELITSDAAKLKFTVKTQYDLKKASKDVMSNFNDSLILELHSRRLIGIAMSFIGPLVSVKDIMYNPERCTEQILGLINNQLLNGNFQYENRTDSTGQVLYDLAIDKDGKVIRNDFYVETSRGIWVDDVTFNLNDNPMVKKLIHDIARLQLEQQEAIAEAEKQKMEILASGTAAEKIEMQKYFAMMEATLKKKEAEANVKRAMEDKAKYEKELEAKIRADVKKEMLNDTIK